jgi:hypothetical protein
MNNLRLNLKWNFLKTFLHIPLIIKEIFLNEVSCLLDFVKRKPFKVVELDKNVGVGIIDKRLYNKLCLEFLSNPDGYEKMDHDPFINSCKY